MPDASRALRSQLAAPADNFVLTPDNTDIVMLIPAGHKIGKPAPLFEKLETARVDELRQRFGGVQEKPASGAASDDIKKLEQAVQEQADKVRIMKSSGVEKTKWQPEVAVLLDLKKQLETAQKSVKSSPKKTPAAQPQAGGDVASLEKAVQAQGEKVRALKSSGAEKSTWQPEVTILLSLKKQLEAAHAQNSTNPSVDVKTIEAEIEKQVKYFNHFINCI